MREVEKGMPYMWTEKIVSAVFVPIVRHPTLRIPMSHELIYAIHTSGGSTPPYIPMTLVYVTVSRRGVYTYLFIRIQLLNLSNYILTKKSFPPHSKYYYRLEKTLHPYIHTLYGGGQDIYLPAYRNYLFC